MAGLAGLLAGVLHVLLGPDHLAAVLPFAVAKPRSGARVGLFWGLGHGLGVLALGAALLAFRGAFDVELVSARAEALVGFLLVGLGSWALWRSRYFVVHAHGHAHGASEDDHVHPHVHVGDLTVDHPEHAVLGRHRAHHHSTMGFGFVHGMAGMGHFVAASPIAALGLGEGALYLAGYLSGGVAAMTAFAFGAGTLIRRPSWVPRGIAASGALSITVGLFWIASS
ncbi:MAG: hypothetical protein AAGD10_14670 [Myxococcota bacterium]